MNRRRIFRGLAGLLVLACLGVTIYTLENAVLDAQEAASTPASPPAPPETPKPLTTADPFGSWLDIVAALDEHGEWDFSEATLAEIVKSVQTSSKIDVVIDTRALEDVGISPDTPITCHVKNISLRGFLRLVLGGLDLAHDIHDGALLITTPETFETRLTTEFYPVADLARVSNDAGESAYDYDSLSLLITTTLLPDTWDDVGGPGAIDGIYGSLIVSQTADVHKQLSLFLTAFRQVLRAYKDNPAGPGEPVSLNQSAEQANIQAALKERITIDIQDVQLSEAVKTLSDLSKIPIVVDRRALDDYGLDSNVTVTARVKDVPLGVALRRMLAPHDLMWTVHDEVLSITTPDSDCEWNEVCLYPVYDLLAMPGATGRAEHDFDSLIYVLISNVQPDSWDDFGGPGSIEPIVNPPALVISQTQSAHEELRALLNKLRQARQLDREARKKPTNAKPHLTIQSYAVQPGLDAQNVLRLIIKLLGADILEGEGVLLEILGDRLVVRHHRNGHQQIQGLLRQLQTVQTFGSGGGVFRSGSGGGFGAGGGGFGGGGSF